MTAQLPAAAAGMEIRVYRPADFAAVVPHPSKVVCVGQNYRSHIEEMGREIPPFPVLFAKYADTLTDPYAAIAKPAETDQLDWECELAVVIGREVRRADERSAAAAIAGFTALNDLSVRDWQFRTAQWLQGKMWEATVKAYQKIHGTQAGGATVEVVWKDLADINPAQARALAQELIVLERGVPVFHGPVEELRRDGAILDRAIGLEKV